MDFSLHQIKPVCLSSSRQLPEFSCTIEEMEDHKKQIQESNFARINRNLIERNRRNQMKDLLSMLFSIIPTSQNSKLSVPELLDQATIYTKQLQEKIKTMSERKELLKHNYRRQNFEPVINIKYSLECTDVEITIIIGLKKNLLLHQVIRVIEEEGAEVVSTSYHSAGEKAFYTILAKAFSSRIGIATATLDERLKKLVS